SAEPPSSSTSLSDITSTELPGTSSESPRPVIDAVEVAEVTILSPGNTEVDCRAGEPLTATFPIGVIIAVAVSASTTEAGNTTAITHAKTRNRGFLTVASP